MKKFFEYILAPIYCVLIMIALIASFPALFIDCFIYDGCFIKGVAKGVKGDKNE